MNGRILDKTFLVANPFVFRTLRVVFGTVSNILFRIFIRLICLFEFLITSSVNS